jgi:ribonucleotide reductase class II
MFSDNAPSANPVFFRTYSRRTKLGYRETWGQVCDRTAKATSVIGRFTEEEWALIDKYQRELKTLSSGRWLWVGGTKWIGDPLNVYGGYNCSGTAVVDWAAFGLIMNLAMTGCGTGAGLEEKFISQLPVIRNKLTVEIKQEIGAIEPRFREEETEIFYYEGDRTVDINVGDSRKGWVDAYRGFLELSSDERIVDDLKVNIYLGHVRKSGEKLKSFGGTANPAKLTDLWEKLARVLNGAIGRKLNYEECCLLIDEAAIVIVAGNIRRSAGIRQFDVSAKLLKSDLWQQDEQGNWFIDPARDALRIANHTRVYHQKPTKEECIDAVRSQYYSGEGAIQWAGEAIARSNADLLNNPNLKKEFLASYQECPDDAKFILGYIAYKKNNGVSLGEKELNHRINRCLLNPCGEITGFDFMCDLSEVHLNNVDPLNFEEQKSAFEAGALNVVALLHQKFPDERYQYSREIDPIVAVCPTGVFDFFVKLFGVDWLKWWEAGRPEEWKAEDNIKLWYATGCFPEESEGNIYKRIEKKILSWWSDIVHKKAWEYCDRHNLRRPNRCTAVQPSGSKSLLTGASSGWHPPKAQRFIRRITFRKNDPVALACIDYGYNVIPSQSDKDENGNLLNDPHSPFCTEWLVEIPTEVPWANLPGADQIDISKFSALAQFDFWMQVQKHYVTHNASSTIELREGEIEELGDRIYRAIQNDEGYISTALLARFDDLQSFPRLPFEPIDKETYDRLSQEVKARRKTDDFCEALAHYDLGEIDQAGPAGCDSDKCMFPMEKP